MPVRRGSGGADRLRSSPRRTMPPVAPHWARGLALVGALVGALAFAARFDVARAIELPPVIGVTAALGPAGVAFSSGDSGFELNPALVADVDRAIAGLELGLESGAETPRRIGLRVPAAERAGLGLDFASGRDGAFSLDRRFTEWRLSAGRRLARPLAVGAALQLRRESAAGTHDTSYGV